MIVLDEAVHGPSIAGPIRTWYVGRVLSITALRPKTVIKDDAIPTLLRAADHPTFVTINVMDFWRKIAPDPHFGIVCVDMPPREVLELSDLLRRFFRLAHFRARSARMGKVVRLRQDRLQYYEVDRHVRSMLWP